MPSEYMQRALALARRSLGWCSPNPAVGAVLVRDGRIVGEGYTQPPGQAHAEVMALQAAGPAATGADLYVTLEPCSHHGRTPPCTDALIGGGVRSVYAAMLDPSPWVDGEGLRALERAGVATSVGEGAAEAMRLNEAYLKWLWTSTPFVTLKYAMTADGKIATRSGSSSWISGREARAYVARLRTEVDVVLVGVNTVIADDPQLTARPEDFGEVVDGPAHQPLRVVLDSTARMPAAARLVGGGLPGKTLVCATPQAPRPKLRELEDEGVEVAVLPDREGRVDLDELMAFLGGRGVISVLAECGGTLAAALLAAGHVDKLLALVAPKIVGGASAPTPVEGVGLESMAEALELRDPEWTVLGRDVVLAGYIAEPAVGHAGDPAVAASHAGRRV